MGNPDLIREEGSGPVGGHGTAASPDNDRIPVNTPGPLGHNDCFSPNQPPIRMASIPQNEEDADERRREDWCRNRRLELKLEKETLARETPVHIQKCINKLAALPGQAWRSALERNLILAKLNSLNKANKIKFENIEDRGLHDKEGNITIAEELHWGNWEKDAWMKSAPVLVHEATHAVWRERYFDQFRVKWQKNHEKSYKDHPKGEAYIAEEMYAWENELIVYKTLKENYSDTVLEGRLERQGNLEAVVRNAYSGWIYMDGIK